MIVTAGTSNITLNKKKKQLPWLKKSTITTPFALAVANKYKPPLEKFKTMDDFIFWAKEWLKKLLDYNRYEIKEVDFDRYLKQLNRPATRHIYRDVKRNPDYWQKELIRNLDKERNNLFNSWKLYLRRNNCAYAADPFIQIIILEGITRNLLQDNDTMPPELQQGVLADTISVIEKQTDGAFNFLKLYNKKLEKWRNESSLLKMAKTDDEPTRGEWVQIPGKESDPDNFRNNVRWLKALSHINWCTRSFNAAPYLRLGDFYIYRMGNISKVAVRLEENLIAEMQGEENNGIIPPEYTEEVMQLVKLLETSGNIINGKESLEYVRENQKKYEREIALRAATDPKLVYELFGFNVSEDEQGGWILDEYYTVKDELSQRLDDYGFDESALFKNVTGIKGNADFRGSCITSLGQLQYVGGNIYLENSDIKDLGQLRHIGGDAFFADSELENLGMLEHIDGSADFTDCSIASLAGLKYIGGDAFFNGCYRINEIGSLQHIGGFAFLDDFLEQELKEQIKKTGGSVRWVKEF